jgi:hypothetical protein
VNEGTTASLIWAGLTGGVVKCGLDQSPCQTSQLSSFDHPVAFAVNDTLVAWVNNASGEVMLAVQ